MISLVAMSRRMIAVEMEMHSSIELTIRFMEVRDSSFPNATNKEMGLMMNFQLEKVLCKLEIIYSNKLTCGTLFKSRISYMIYKKNCT